MKRSIGAKFTQNEAIILSGLSRDKLRKLEERNIVVPIKNPISYTWTQIIFLRIIYKLRLEKWTFKQIEKVLQYNDLVELDILKGQLFIFNEHRFGFINTDEISYKRTAKNLSFEDISFPARFQLSNDEGVITSSQYTCVDISYLVKELLQIGTEKISNFLQTINRLPVITNSDFLVG